MHPADDHALNTEERIWDLTMQINVKGVWWGCKYAILAMRQNPTDESKGLHAGGSIINTASFVASVGAATSQLACEFTIYNDATFLNHASLFHTDTASKVRQLLVSGQMGLIDCSGCGPFHDP
jgi:NAD(P)-dependent dehydrogenase (short-subunit alcohol dehydrogenase family)